MKKFLSLPPVSFAVEAAGLYLRVGASRAAAALSYFLILTLFPLLVCVNYFIGLFHLDLENLLQSLDQILPAEALAVIQDYLGYVSESQSRALLLASLITILISASAGLRTLLAAMDDLPGPSGGRCSAWGCPPCSCSPSTCRWWSSSPASGFSGCWRSSCPGI